MAEKNETPALILQMKSRLGSLTKMEKRVADYIIEHPGDVIYLSVAGLAEKSETSDATVIRTCKKLGMASYQEFKVTLAQSIAAPLKTLNEDIEEGDSIETVITKVFESTIHTLKLTRDILKSQVLEAAADALFSARRIFIFGMGNSSAVGADLLHKMLRLGLPAYSESDSHLQRIMVATLVEKGDVIFAISHSGSSKDVVDTAAMAKKKGATLISLTDISRSPLYDIADIRLCTMSEETKYRMNAMSSRIAQYTIIDTLHTLISYKNKEPSLKCIHSVEKSMFTLKY